MSEYVIEKSFCTFRVVTCICISAACFDQTLHTNFSLKKAPLQNQANLNTASYDLKPINVANQRLSNQERQTA